MDPILSVLGAYDLTFWKNKNKGNEKYIYRFYSWIFNTVSKITTVDFTAVYISFVRIVLCAGCNIQTSMEQQIACFHFLMIHQIHIAIDKQLQDWYLVSGVYCPDQSIEQRSNDLNFDRTTKMERFSAVMEVQILWIFTVNSAINIPVSTRLFILNVLNFLKRKH